MCRQNGLELTIPLAEGTGTYAEESVTVSPAGAEAPTGQVQELSSAERYRIFAAWRQTTPCGPCKRCRKRRRERRFQTEFSVRDRHTATWVSSSTAWQHRCCSTPYAFTEDTGSIAMINTDVVSRAALSTRHAATHGNWLGATLEFDMREGS